MKWAVAAIGIGMVGLLLAGCTDVQGSAGDWEAEVGALETALSEVRDLARSNAESIQALQQRIETHSETGSPDGAEPRGLEEIEQLSDRLTGIQQALEELSTRVSEIESTLSQRPQRSGGSSGGRP